MKPTKLIKYVCCHMWAVSAVLFLFIDILDAIRVYEGTNFPSPVHRSSKTGISKKSLYITKRSWNEKDEKLITASYGEGSWKNFTKRTGIEGAPTLYKIKFADKSFIQYLRYIKEIPRLEEYTFCLWYKSQNMSHDQTLFTYSLNKNEVLLRFWIHPKDFTFRMAIRETPVYKVAAVIRENKWHHICQSWNGVLGEWQVFFDGKRIGAGVLSYYTGTYIPEGGEVTLGQELIGLKKRLNDGIDGEIFGFNLVDEAVPQDQGLFINSQYKPNIQRGSVPPFKKLPPMKKTYQEIKAYITSLPTDPAEAQNKNEGFPIPGESSNIYKKPKEKIPPKRDRGNQRLRYPPLRKVVVYNRDDRQLPVDEALIELNRTKPSQSKNQTTESLKESRPEDVKFSIHSYRPEKTERKLINYEIYEDLEDDRAKTISEDEQTNEQSLERKARENFNLYTARQANKVYTLSSSVKDTRKPKFHFERMTEEQENSNRRSLKVEDSVNVPSDKNTKRTSADSIPVYERRKRSTEKNRESRLFTEDALTDSNGFRRLPQIPDSFISIFTQNTSQLEMEEKLDQFFPKDSTKEETIVLPETTTTTTTEAPERSLEETVLLSLPATNNARIEQFTTEMPIPSFSPIPADIPSRDSFPQMPSMFSSLSNQGPVNFPMAQEFNPRPSVDEMRTPLTYANPEQEAEPVMERRYDLSSGTDLVMRSYGECTADRGSPIRDKQHLVISWADTPVRIFGGAQVEAAKNQCGYF